MDIVVGVDICGESNLVFLELITKIIKEQFKGIEIRTRNPEEKYKQSGFTGTNHKDYKRTI